MLKRVLAALKRPSLKLMIIAIVFTVLLPTLGVVSATLYRTSQSFYDASARQLLETSLTVSRAAQRELSMIASVLQHLEAQQGPGGYAAQSSDTVSSFANGVLQRHVLLRTDGQWDMQQASAPDPVLHPLVQAAAQTGRFQISNIVLPAAPDGPMHVVLAVPSPSMPSTFSRGTVRVVTTLTTQPQHLLHALTRQGENGLSVILAITDGQGRVVERSVDSARFVGKPVPSWKTLQEQGRSSGTFRAQTLEGREIVFAYQRIDGTPGWVAVVGEAANSLQARSQQPIRVMLQAAAVTIGLALLLALLLARKVLQPIRSLATHAQRIAADQRRSGPHLVSDVPPSFVAEFEVLRQSLDQADQVVQRLLAESREAEHQAQMHLKVLQAAEEQARLGHWTLDLHTSLLQCSEMLSVLYGDLHQPLVLHMDELRERLHADSYERIHLALHQCITQKMPQSLEVLHLRRDGSAFAAYVRGAPQLNACGEVVSISGTLQDISEAKEHTDRLSALADNLPSGVIFRLQRTGARALALQFVSAGLETLTGLSAAALLRNAGPLLRAIAPGDVRRMLRVLQQAQQPGHVLDAEFALRTARGEVVWLHCRAALRYPATGGGIWDGIARDVTAERAAEQALKAAKEAAESAERAKSDFLATMSHEIRTPMNSVIGMSRLALRTPLNPQQRNYLEKINQSANVLLGILNDILDFSKIEAGGLVLESVPFRMEAVLDTVASINTLKAEEKGLEIIYHVEGDVPSVLRGDPLRLGQVLNNLVSNAVKFTSHGDVLVHVRWSAQGEGNGEGTGGGPLLHCAVRDSGVGLSAAQIAGLFQPFAQAGADTSRHYGGTGLGLAICKRLVEMMGGRIGVQSTPGEGSTFSFFVRVESVEAAGQTKQLAHSQGASLQGLRILIADDNAMARTALAEMAHSFGMQVHLRANGQEALQALREHAAQGEPFDMVVLDWHMPVMDGVQAAQQLKSEMDLAHMPALLMVTAYGQEAMLKACEGGQVQVQAVLLKPVTPSAMFNTLLAASSGRQAPAAYSERAPEDWSDFAALQGLRVLVADDNALNREVATDFLLQVGVQVYTAVDGLDAIRCLQAQHVDAVLLDIHMPHMDGLSAAREIRRHARWKDLPIWALSAQARREDVQTSLDAGMNGHLTKPIDEKALYRALLAHCPTADGKRVRADAPAVLAQMAASVQDALPSAGAPSPGEDADGGVAHSGPVPVVAQPTIGTQLRECAPSDGADPVPFARLSRSPVRRAALLRGFLHDFDDVPQRFAQLLAQAHWAQLADMVHQLKGSASYLDAHELHATANQIEAAARGGQSEVLKRQGPTFVAQVQACLDSVRTALTQLPAAAPEGESDPLVGTAGAPASAPRDGGAAPAAVPDMAAAVRPLIERLRPLVASGNFAAQQLLTELAELGLHTAWAGTAQAALEAFDDLERERTLALLDAIAVHSGAALQG